MKIERGWCMSFKFNYYYSFEQNYECTPLSALCKFDSLTSLPVDARIGGII